MMFCIIYGKNLHIIYHDIVIIMIEDITYYNNYSEVIHKFCAIICIHTQYHNNNCDSTGTRKVIYFVRAIHIGLDGHCSLYP